MKPKLDRISSPCVRGKHTQCQAFGACECRCHAGVPVGEIESAEGGNLHAVPGITETPVVEVEQPSDVRDAALDAGLVWEAPPRRYGPRRVPELLTDHQAELLRSRPGEWARVKSFTGESSAHTFRKRWIDRCRHTLKSAERYPDTEWEVIARKLPDKSSALWVRYKGPSTTPA